VWARFLFRKFCFGLKNPWNQSIPSKSIHKCLMTVVVFYVLAEINKTTIRYKIKCLHNWRDSSSPLGKDPDMVSRM
jgi:hypothetical protein